MTAARFRIALALAAATVGLVACGGEDASDDAGAGGLGDDAPSAAFLAPPDALLQPADATTVGGSWEECPEPEGDSSFQACSIQGQPGDRWAVHAFEDRSGARVLVYGETDTGEMAVVADTGPLTTTSEGVALWPFASAGQGAVLVHVAVGDDEHAYEVVSETGGAVGVVVHLGEQPPGTVVQVDDGIAVTSPTARTLLARDAESGAWSAVAS